MTFAELPSSAAWSHVDSRSGFEVAYFHHVAEGLTVEGATAAIRDGQMWAISYVIEIDPAWRTRRASVTGRSASGARTTVIEADGDGLWSIDGASAAHLDGCIDIDLESSAVTNTLPVHRLALGVDERADAPAAWVRAAEVTTERLEQTYTRREDVASRQQYDYHALAFDFTSRMQFDRHGLVVEYPGIARRAG